MYYAEKLKCYVVATLTLPTEYVHVLGNKKYMLSTKLSGATKIVNRKTAIGLIDSYRHSTGDLQDLVVVPLEVTYELIDERI